MWLEVGISGQKHREGEEITRYTEKAGLRKRWRSY